jgi:tetratricopeptide (TPR) repeat protein
MSDIDQEQLAGLSQADLVSKALTALHHNHSYLAMVCLEQAATLGHSSIIDSYLGYCLALNRQDYTAAIRLGEAALHQEPNNPLFCHNLGRSYLLAGQKPEAIRIFRQGLAFSRDETLIAELNRIGTRKPAVIPVLPRDHLLNKWLGKLLFRLGLR